MYILEKSEIVRGVVRVYLDLECTKIEEEHAFAMVYFVGREGFNEVSKRARMLESEGCGTYF